MRTSFQFLSAYVAILMVLPGFALASESSKLILGYQIALCSDEQTAPNCGTLDYSEFQRVEITLDTASSGENGDVLTGSRGYTYNREGQKFLIKLTINKYLEVEPVDLPYEAVLELHMNDSIHNLKQRSRTLDDFKYTILSGGLSNTRSVQFMVSPYFMSEIEGV